MGSPTGLYADRKTTNPAFNNRKLKLGTFQTNLDSGCVMSDLDGRLEINWPNTVQLAKYADEMEFEAIVPVARWRGFGGKVNPQGPGFETYTWAAGIAASTTHPGVVSTSHVSVNHPRASFAVPRTPCLPDVRPGGRRPSRHRRQPQAIQHIACEFGET